MVAAASALLVNGLRAPADLTGAMASRFAPLDDASVSKLIQAKLPTEGLAVAALSVKTNSDHRRLVDVTLQAQDIAEAKAAAIGIVIDMRHFLVRDSGMPDLQIAVFTLTITVPNNQAVLKYVRDGVSETYWHADGVYANGFSMPPTVEATATKQ